MELYIVKMVTTVLMLVTVAPHNIFGVSFGCQIHSLAFICSIFIKFIHISFASEEAGIKGGVYAHLLLCNNQEISQNGLVLGFLASGMGSGEIGGYP